MTRCTATPRPSAPSCATYGPPLAGSCSATSRRSSRTRPASASTRGLASLVADLHVGVMAGRHPVRAQHALALKLGTGFVPVRKVGEPDQRRRTSYGDQAAPIEVRADASPRARCSSSTTCSPPRRPGRAACRWWTAAASWHQAADRVGLGGRDRSAATARCCCASEPWIPSRRNRPPDPGHLSSLRSDRRGPPRRLGPRRRTTEAGAGGGAGGR